MSSAMSFNRLFCMLDEEVMNNVAIDFKKVLLDARVSFSPGRVISILREGIPDLHNVNVHFFKKQNGISNRFSRRRLCKTENFCRKNALGSLKASL